MNQYDVIVVGAGPAGSAAAYFLAKDGINVLLLDKSAFPRDKTCGDGVTPRAQHVLQEMNLLDELLEQGYQAYGVSLHAPNGHHIVSPVDCGPDLPAWTLVIPRYKLDHVIQQRAIDAGAHFRVANVKDVLWEGERVVGVKVGDEEIRAPLVVIATGAATSLLKAAGLLPHKPTFAFAARGYYTDIATLEPQIEFYFNADGVPLPGYAWFFPTGPHSANTGIGFLGKDQQVTSSKSITARSLFEPVMKSHPRLSYLLQGARLEGPLKSYPLRVDFLTAPKMRPGVMATGEAIGLVNPFTGEGIDYALEAGKIAAHTILDAMAQGEPTFERLQPYIKRLNNHFRKLMFMMKMNQICFYNPPILNRLFGSGDSQQRVADTLIKTCFGTGDPSTMYTPRMIFDVLRARPLGQKAAPAHVPGAASDGQPVEQAASVD
jgi:geranylgeranyl reductase family protein